MGDERPAAPPSERARVSRVPQRAAYERATVEAILDAGRVAHLGTTRDGAPVVVPTLYARVEERVYVHGSSAARSLRALGDGFPACLTVTLVDGLVLARSAFHHSVDYRSVVIHGTARPVHEPDDKMAALEALTDKIVPGRWREARQPTAQELRATSVLWLPLDEASAKVRTGPPADDEPDYELDVWAGNVPLETVVGALVPDPRLRPGIAVSPSVERLTR